MYLKDAYVEKGHLIAITDKGKVYEWDKDWSDVNQLIYPLILKELLQLKIISIFN